MAEMNESYKIQSQLSIARDNGEQPKARLHLTSVQDSLSG